jgi:hypothetical protein
MSSDLISTLEAERVDILFVATFNGLDILTLTATTRAKGVLTCTAQASYVEQGLSVAVGRDDHIHPILINIEAATGEGSDFRPGLLKMAQVILGPKR